MNDIMKYLQIGKLPENDKNAHKIRVQTTRFTLIGDNLYSRSFGRPYLKCMSNLEAQYILAELHEGIYDNHAGGRTLAYRAHSQGYYWPTMRRDAEHYIRRCDRC